jgi:O-methyltransferase involved in polyketide biosynthesis
MFRKEPWLDTLKRHDFDPDLPTFFLWEGVIYYLEPEAVYATLDAASSQGTDGSAIAFDYLSQEMIEGRGSLFVRYSIKVLQATGEPLLFGISTDPPARQQVATLLEAHRLTLERYEPFGEESANKKPFGGLVMAVSNMA